MVDIKGLSKRFGRFVAVNKVSLQAQPGEIFGLLGQNGAGKTTLMRMLATVLRPDEGDAEVGGIRLTDDPDGVRRCVGLLTADAGLYERLSAKENVQYFGELHNISSNILNERIAELFDMLELSAVATKPVGQFSKGMRQKVCLARTFVHDPKVLLLDEPSTGLDVGSARSMYDFILHKKQAGKTIIFSSHVMSEVEKLCDRIAVIHHGEIVAQGTVKEMQQTHLMPHLEDIFLRLVGGA